MRTMNISNDIKYIGVNDHELDLFEGQYVVPLGMAYNSYLVLDEKNVVFDTVDERFGDEWLANLKRELGDATVDSQLSAILPRLIRVRCNAPVHPRLCRKL